MIGKLKFFDGVKGYGFITIDDGRDIFFHYTNLKVSKLEQKRLKTMVGAVMEFTLGEGPRGPMAKDVTLSARPAA